MDKQHLPQHVTVLGWLHIIGGFFFIALAIFIFILLAGVGLLAATEDPEALGVLSIIGVLVGGLMGVLALPSMLAGYGLLKRKSWSRILAIIIGVLSLMNFPVGTLLGVYTLIVLLQPEAADYFASPPPKMA